MKSLTSFKPVLFFFLLLVSGFAYGQASEGAKAMKAGDYEKALSY